MWASPVGSDSRGCGPATLAWPLITKELTENIFPVLSVIDGDVRVTRLDNPCDDDKPVITGLRASLKSTPRPTPLPTH